MKDWYRFFFQPCLPLGKNGKRVTGCAEHIQVSQKAAEEGMVLLKNNNQVLPFEQNQRIALFGKAVCDYVKGGGGSGDVTVAYTRSLLDALLQKEREGSIQLYSALNEYYANYVDSQYKLDIEPGLVCEPDVPIHLIQGARDFTSTAVVAISRFSGENWDRTIENDKATNRNEFQKAEEGLLNKSRQLFEKGDYYLSESEQRLVDTVKQKFENVVVVLNVGGIVDSSWFYADDRIDSVLLSWQGGMEGGMAAANILCGDVNPSGKLTDTFAKKLEDYPSTATFHESKNYVGYVEDIYVGYRYFETIPGAYDKVNYPFGYGLSYTEFKISEVSSNYENGIFTGKVKVENTGSIPGKEVVQLYVNAPTGKLGKAKYELKDFVKTRLLRPGESQVIELKTKDYDMSSYDDLGKICKSSYVLEKGTYSFLYGNHIRNLNPFSFRLELNSDILVKTLSAKCVPNMLEYRMLHDGTMEKLQLHPEKVNISLWNESETPVKGPDADQLDGTLLFGDKSGIVQLEDVASGKHTLNELIDQLDEDELIGLLCGHPNMGVANTFGYGSNYKHGIPNVMTADGPAGLRINEECGIFTTAFPCATLLACTWNEALIEKIGIIGALEVKENNIGIWLTPAICIHRSPLCGRNFEYFSEDPLVSGRMGAAMVKGIQSQNIGAALKHFACNNKETYRHESDSRVSERALREIYLKGFEYVVGEADPWIIMSSYNIVNGIRSSENAELLTDILRGEWNYQGMVTSDWWNHAEQYREILAGNDVKMGCGFPKRLKEDYENGRISKNAMVVSATRVLKMILKLK